MFKRAKILILLVALLLSVIVFRKFFFEGLVPIPADIVTAGYYPWADSVWGYPVKVPIKNSLPSDVPSLLYPWRFHALEILKTGHLPLWDNTSLLGTPLFANFQAALLNPANVLFFVFAEKLAWSWQVILQLPLLFLATFAFLRNLKLGRAAAIFGALSFALSGQALVWLEYTTVYSMVYFPLLLLLADKLALKPKLHQVLLIAFFLAFQIFSGYPLYSLYTLAFLVFYFLYRLGQQRQASLKKFFLLLLGIVGGLGLAAIQLIPGQELASLSVREFDNTAIAGNIKYLPFANLFSFFIPDLFGNPGTQNYWGIGSFDNFAFFIPAAAGYFFLLSLVTKVASKRENLVFLLICLLSLLYALPNPIPQIFGKLNFFDLGATVNARLLFAFSFGASVLAALAFEETLKNKVSTFCKILPLTVFFAVVIALFVAYLNAQKLERETGELVTSNANPTVFFQDSAETALDAMRVAVADFKIGLRNTAIPTAVALATFVLTAVNVRRFNMLLIPLLALAVLPTFDKYLSFTRADLVFPEMEALTRLRELTGDHRFEREKAEILPANTWSVYGLNSASGQNAVAPLSTVRYLEMINRGKLDDRLLTRFVHVDNTKSPLFDTLDIETVAYLDHDEKLSIPHKDGRPYPWLLPDDFTELANIGTVRIYRNTNNLGPAWFAQNVVCEHELEKSAQIMAAEDFNPRRIAVIACAQDVVDAELGKVQLLEKQPNSLRFEADTPDGNYLLLSQADFPGWKAYLDGNPVPLKTANIGLTSVYVPRGKYEIELKYDPPSVKVGIAVTAVTLTAWVFALTSSAIKHSKK